MAKLEIPYVSHKATVLGKALNAISWIILMLLMLVGSFMVATEYSVETIILWLSCCIVGISIFLLMQLLIALYEKRNEQKRTKLQSKKQVIQTSASQRRTEPMPESKLKESLCDSDFQQTEMVLHEKRCKVISKCMEVLQKQLSVRINECTFEPFTVMCDFPGTKNKACLRLIPDAVDKSFCRLTVNLIRDGSDVCVMNYLFKGTRQEIMDWLSNENHVVELMADITHLSESLDEKLD